MEVMNKLVRRIDLREARADSLFNVLRREWLVTNGLGGYASGTISGVVTWRYHGLLIAALPAPLGRVVVLNHLAEYVRLRDGRLLQIGGEETTRPEEVLAGGHCITEFRLENQVPVWRYEVEGIQLEKHLVLLHGQNTVHVTYRLVSQQQEVHLELRPSMHFRHHGHRVSEPISEDYELSTRGQRFEVSAGPNMPVLRLYLKAKDKLFTYTGGARREIFYAKEADRGYESRGLLWSPGHFNITLGQQNPATLIASTESWSTILALDPEEALRYYIERRGRLIRSASARAQSSPAADLVLASDQFVVNPVGRVQDTARAHAAGDELRTVIAGYHWFTDWGRDTMISLEGLTLLTGRHGEAGWILRTFAHYIRHGLIPNMFPEGENQGLYHTADATLWFFHALERYLQFTGDRDTLRQLLPSLQDIVEHHLRGTLFDIAVDPRDGLLSQGAEDYPAHLDGRKGGRLGSHPAQGQGRRNQRALV